MKIARLTQIDPVAEAVDASRSRAVTATLETELRISTRAQRAHKLLGGLAFNQSRHIASMGELSLHDVAAEIAGQYGPFDCLTLSTWAASDEAIKRIIALRDAGKVRRLEALVDGRMPTDCPDAHALMSLSFDLYKPAQNHSKIMAFTGGREMREACGGTPWREEGIAVVSTANLTHNPRCEVLVVTVSNAIAEFHRDWIREAIQNAN